MYRNCVWIIFLSMIGLTIFIYTGSTLVQVYKYQRLQHPVEANEIKWTIKCFAVDACSPQADYTFLYKGQIYAGQTIFAERYLNQWTATEAIQRMKPLKVVWINPSHPNDSTMEKEFPLKSTLYTGLLWGLLIYFILLGRYIARKY